MTISCTKCLPEVTQKAVKSYAMYLPKATMNEMLKCLLEATIAASNTKQYTVIILLV